MEHTGTMRLPAARASCRASSTRMVARPRPPNAGSTSVWSKTR
ncbi:hypothetical protein MMMB2_4646 [Mycobacterium marinum MB2]|nr:hypothetical protein MMMB2_4646 [Mycobacterium marinum MB2]